MYVIQKRRKKLEGQGLKTNNNTIYYIYILTHQGAVSITVGSEPNT